MIRLCYSHHYADRLHVLMRKKRYPDVPLVSMPISKLCDIVLLGVISHILLKGKMTEAGRGGGGGGGGGGKGRLDWKREV